MNHIRLELFTVIAGGKNFSLLFRKAGDAKTKPLTIEVDAAANPLLNQIFDEKPSGGFRIIPFLTQVLSDLKGSVSRLLIEKWTGSDLKTYLQIKTGEELKTYPVGFAEGVALAVQTKAFIHIEAGLWDELCDTATLYGKINLSAPRISRQEREHEEDSSFRDSPFRNLDEELQKLGGRLKEAVNRELYEEAAKIRDQIEKLKKYKTLKN